MRPHGKPQTLEKRRHLAIRLLKQGRTYRSVAQELDASLSSVVRWHQSYQKKGRKGLRYKPHPGRPPLLSSSQKKALVRVLVKGPLEAGYWTDVWTLNRIGQVIRKQFGFRYCVGSLWNLMQALGWSCQVPTKKAKERREAEIRYWKHHVWPHIKKGRSAWSPLGLPG
ncbi:MAG: winged helix-turn-helix domain-containing protein [Candidatus Micrarchaeota archaeon]